MDVSVRQLIVKNYQHYDVSHHFLRNLWVTLSDYSLTLVFYCYYVFIVFYLEILSWLKYGTYIQMTNKWPTLKIHIYSFHLSKILSSTNPAVQLDPSDLLSVRKCVFQTSSSKCLSFVCRCMARSESFNTGNDVSYGSMTWLLVGRLA